jgi:hypothetical protein
MGIGFTVAANGKSADAATMLEELKKQTPPGVAVCAEPTGSRAPSCTEIMSNLGDRDAHSRIALGSFIAGGVLAVGTVGYAVLTPTRPTKTREMTVRAVPVIGTGIGGIVVIGTW